jgi:Protein of unknown function (DUF3040)
MALSMDEQRVLAEIERRLAADDPGLATCLTSFRRPSPATVLRSPRARIIGSLFTVLLVAMVSLMVYAMIPFRTHSTRTPTAPSGNTQGHVSISAATPRLQSQTTPPASARTSAGALVRPPGRPTTPAAGANAGPSNPQGTRSQAAGQTIPAAAGP